MLSYYQHTGQWQPAAVAAGIQSHERTCAFVCSQCGQPFGLPYSRLRNLSLPDDAPCPYCGSALTRRAPTSPSPAPVTAAEADCH